MALQDILIPDIGDAEDVEVIEILVAAGDVVRVDDGLIVIESDKASMEVPAPYAGRVESIAVALGDTVGEGQLIARLEMTDERVVPAPATDGESSTGAGEVPIAERGPVPEVKAEVKVETEPEPVSAKPEALPVVPDAARQVEARVPDIGDAEGVEVIEVAVAVGDAVAVDDLLVVVESDKASMEIPAPVAGRIVEVPISLGDEVVEGTLLAIIESDAAALADAGGGSPDPARPLDGAPGSEPRPDEPDAQHRPAAPAEQMPGPSSDVAAPKPAEHVDADPSAAAVSVYAGPAVRRLARELGVDLGRVAGSGSKGRILKDDVQAFVKTALTTGLTGTAETAGIPEIPEVDFSRFGPIEVVELSRIRARGAENLRRSWLNVVHVTQHDDADVTELESFRRDLKDEAAARSIKLTPLPFIMCAVVQALKAHPNFNASLDRTARALTLKRYYHVGFAVDTQEGLVVPVVRDADQLGVFDLAERIADLSDRARNGKLSIDDLSGGSFSISSLGAIGGTGFTPIVNAPEVAILGIARLEMKPHWTGEGFEPRAMLPLSLSYDHRAINGAEAGRFVAYLRQVLGDIRRLLL